MDLLLHLESFVAVAEEMNFSHAADELGIAQPLLSRRIKALEQQLGGELFDRGRRQIRITDLGTLLLPHAKDLLGRSEHLLGVVRAARSTAAVTLAVPPDCDPRSLAHVIRSAAERGIVLRIEEVPASQRVLGDGAAALALIRVPPAEAAIRVRLGLASTEPLTGPVHLDALRARRGAPRADTPLLLTGEDDLPITTAALRRAAARAGVLESRIRCASSTAAALAETLAGHAVLLCSEQFARRHRVGWAPLADTALCRGYDLAGTALEPSDWLLPLLAAAVGATSRADPDEAADRRLAASG